MDKSVVIMVETMMARRGMFHRAGTTSSHLENGAPAIYDLAIPS